MWYDITWLHDTRLYNQGIFQILHHSIWVEILYYYTILHENIFNDKLIIHELCLHYLWKRISRINLLNEYGSVKEWENNLSHITKETKYIILFLILSEAWYVIYEIFSQTECMSLLLRSMVSVIFRYLFNLTCIPLKYYYM